MRTIVRDEQLAGFPEGVEMLSKPRMPPAPLLIRLKTSTLLRRAVPTELVVARAERKAHRLWQTHPPTRERALDAVRAVVVGTHREGDVEALAEQHVVERQAWEALFWQPWRVPSIDEDSVKLVRETCARERGVIISACHLGPFFAVARMLDTLGVVQYIVMGEWSYEEPSHDLWGRRCARWRIGLPTVPIVRPRGSYDVLAELLRRKLVTTVYFDLPGRRETRFLGKTVSLVDGSARLAWENDALVLPQRARRDGARVSVEYFEPLDPREHSGPEEIQDALARVHERLILDEPASLQDPAVTGWDDCARAEGWTRPARKPGPGGGSR
jgi:lauroyl/myristoyl acyltransferase